MSSVNSADLCGSSTSCGDDRVAGIDDNGDDDFKIPLSLLSANAGAIETYEWLKRNRFFRLAEQLCDYTAKDLGRLTRNDLIQLCDLKDGIRLYNMIHFPDNSPTKLTVFITINGNG